MAVDTLCSGVLYVVERVGKVNDQCCFCELMSVGLEAWAHLTLF